MTRCYLDANFLYDRHRDPPTAEAAARRDGWWQRLQEEAGDDPLMVSSLVVDELAYRLALSWLRDDRVADPLTTFRRDSRAAMLRVGGRLSKMFADLDFTGVDFVTSDRAVVERAQRLMADPGLAPRDAFHAAHAIEARCDVIVSADTVFDNVSGIRRLGPPQAGLS